VGDLVSRQPAVASGLSAILLLHALRALRRR